MFKSLVLSSIVLFFTSSAAYASLIISEILADPATGLAGDANADGLGSTSQDEFVEFFNDSLTSLNISNWYVTDSIAMRHVFPVGTIINSHEYLIVFGGGTFTQTTLKEKASTGGLSLNNTGDSVRLFDSASVLIDRVDYDALANHDQSIVRSSIFDVFTLHSEVSYYQGKKYSPGYGLPELVVAVPEPSSMGLLSLGLAGFGWKWRRKYLTNA